MNNVMKGLYPPIHKDNWAAWVEAYQNCTVVSPMHEYIRAWRKEGITWSSLLMAGITSHDWIPSLVRVWEEEGCPATELYFNTHITVQNAFANIKTMPEVVLASIMSHAATLSGNMVIQIVEYRPELHEMVKVHYKKCNNQNVVNLVEDVLSFTIEERLELLRNNYAFTNIVRPLQFYRKMHTSLEILLQQDPTSYQLLTKKDVEIYFKIGIFSSPASLGLVRQILEKRHDLAMVIDPMFDKWVLLSILDPTLMILKASFESWTPVEIKMKRCHDSARLGQILYMWRAQLGNLGHYIKSISIDTQQTLRNFFNMLDIAAQYEGVTTLPCKVDYCFKSAVHSPALWCRYLRGESTIEESTSFEKIYGKKRSVRLKRIWDAQTDKTAFEQAENITSLYMMLVTQDDTIPKHKHDYQDINLEKEIFDEVALVW